ncbi:hypothetical protein OC709_02155 ['Planchonia careya' phytoplasma]|nr:hypothetical protein ['Planchonia careya' phytoplasma]MDO8030301.1 hypothetical protein ['Planchonia careya' phytoplasma]
MINDNQKEIYLKLKENYQELVRIQNKELNIYQNLLKDENNNNN